MLIWSLFLPLFILSSPLDCGVIKKTKGPVHVLRNSQAIRATKMMKLECQDTLVTGKKSRLVVKFPRSKVSLGSNARLAVESVAQDSSGTNQLRLVYGKMRGLFEKDSKEEAAGLTVKTPTAVAGVRGTDFVIEFDPNTRVTEHVTLSGEVLLEMLTTGHKVLAKAGQVITMNEPPPMNFMVASKGDKKKSRSPRKKVIETQELDSSAAEKLTEGLDF